METTNLATIERAATDYGVAAVRIHGLIIAGKISRCVHSPGRGLPRYIMVDQAEVSRYFFENRAVLAEWREALDRTKNKVLK